MLCAIAVFAVLFGTLWPFNPFPANNVQWVPEANGVRFGPGGLVHSQSDLQAATTAGAGQGVSLELLVRPERVDSGGTILSFYERGNPQKLMVRQWTDGLLVTHDWFDKQGRKSTTKFDVDHAFRVERMLHLTMTFGPNGAVVYRNGAQPQLFRRFTISPSDVSGQIVLGTSAVDFRPWQGEVSGLAIYSKELTAAEVARHYVDWTAVPTAALPDPNYALAGYLFHEHQGRVIHSDPGWGPDLIIPRSFDVPDKEMLTSAIREFEPTRLYFNDLVVNILGFMPLGAILCVYFSLMGPRSRAIWFATLIGGVLSLAIEVMQAYIPSRDSGMTDIMTNTAGALLGAAIVPADFVRDMLRVMKIVPGEPKSAPPGD
jgi:VanZ like family/Concanavalin A-like lectin/glucanases superfamily